MRVATLTAIAFLTLSASGLPAAAATLTPAARAVTAARVDALAASRSAGMAATASVGVGSGNAARLAALRAAMDGMSFVEPDDVLELRAAVRHGHRPSVALAAALSRLDAVERRADARVLAAVSGPSPVRLDAAPTDLTPAGGTPLVTASR